MTSSSEENSPQMLDVSLRAMTPNDFRLVDDILADAFSENAITKKVIGSDDVQARLRLLNRRAVRNPHAIGAIADVNGRPVAAYIAADAPHCEPGGIEGLRFMGDAFRALRWRTLRALSMFRETDRSHPKWPHRHLVVLGVLREFQGRGVGSALLDRFCRDADSAGVNSFLETDSEAGRRLYERFGFREVNRSRHGDLDFIYMWRAHVT